MSWKDLVFLMFCVLSVLFSYLYLVFRMKYYQYAILHTVINGVHGDRQRYEECTALAGVGVDFPFFTMATLIFPRPVAHIRNNTSCTVQPYSV